MATGSVPSQIIEKERKKLLEILQQDPDCILDTLTSRKLISEEEYEILENITDPVKKSRKLLILVQKKGEVSCQLFLNCLFNTFSQSATICNLNQGRLHFYTFWAKREKAVFLKKRKWLPFIFICHSPGDNFQWNIKGKSVQDLKIRVMYVIVLEDLQLFCSNAIQNQQLFSCWYKRLTVLTVTSRNTQSWKETTVSDTLGFLYQFCSSFSGANQMLIFQYAMIISGK